MDHALPPEVIDTLDDTALVLAQLAQAGVLPPLWQGNVLRLLERVQGTTARHVWRGA